MKGWQRVTKQHSATDANRLPFEERLNMQTEEKQSTHTPGPWRHCCFADHLPDYVIKYGNVKLAKVNMFAGNPDNAASNDARQGEANARLIAAAPDLLRQLEWVLFQAEQMGCNCGTSEQINSGHNRDCPANQKNSTFKEARAAIAKATGGAR